MQLTEKVMSYQVGCWTWTNLWAHLHQTIERYLAAYRLCPDLHARFMNRFEPRLINMVERFEYRGVVFESLLRRSLKLQLRSLFLELKRERLFESMASAELPLCTETATPYGQAAPDAARPFRAPAGSACRFESLKVSARRCLVAALKNCLHLDEDACRRLSGSCRIDLDWLLSCRDQLLDELGPRLEQRAKALRLLQLLRNEQAAERCLAAEQSGVMETTEGQLRRAARISRLQAKLDQWTVTPRHREIALVLGIPKGTVDSTLHYIRRSQAAPRPEA